MARGKTTTDPRMLSFNAKVGKNVKVKHYKEKGIKRDGTARNHNQAYTANGGQNQAYDPNTKQFTKGSSSTRNGLLAVEGSNNTKGARTWTMTVKDEDGKTVKQSGRSQTATRSQRNYDVREGFNHISEGAARAMLEAGQMTQQEYDSMHGAGGGKYGSLGLSNG